MKHLQSAFEGKNAWWRYLLMIFLVGFISYYTIGRLSTVGYLYAVEFFTGEELRENQWQWILGILLFCGLIGGLFLWFLMKPLHNRSPFTLINGTKKIRWKRFFLAALIWLVFLIIYSVFIFFTTSRSITFSFNPNTFFPLLIICFAVVPVQAGFEELYSRGYLLQGLGVLTKNRIISIVLVTLLFALLHSFNPEVKSAGFTLAMFAYLTGSLFFTLIVVLDDGLEMAWGIHTINNIYGFAIWSSDISSVKSDSLFHIGGSMSYLGVSTMAVLMIICLFVLTKKMKWNWGVLTKKIEV